MPKSYAVRLYISTGFNKGNIPSSPSVLETAPHYDVDAVFERQNRNNGSIRIKAQWDDIKDADYMRLGEPPNATYYVVTNVTSLADLTVELSIIQDDFNTAGGINGVIIKGGWEERSHVGNGEDELFDNVQPEPWTPTERLIIRQKEVVHKKTGNEVKIAAATCDINQAPMIKAQIAKASDSITGDEIKGASVVWPVVPGAPLIVDSSGMGHYISGTELMLSKQSTSDDTNSFTLPGVYLYNVNNDKTREFINTMRSLGIENAITAMYTVPAEDILVNETETSIITKVQGRQKTYSPTQPYNYGTVKNAKALSLYNQYTVVSMASGDAADYEAKQLYSGGSQPEWDCIVDPSPTGTVYLQPTHYEGSATKPFEQSVTGSPWLNAGFTYTTSSGSDVVLMNALRANKRISMNMDYAETGNTWANRQMDVSRDRNTMNAAFSTIGGLGNIIGSAVNGDVLGGASGINGLVSGLTNSMYNELSLIASRNMVNNIYDQSVANNTFSMGDNIFNANVSANLIAPELAFPVSANNAAYFGNAFMIAHITLGDNDLIRFDKFLTMYGYAVDRPFKQADLTNRTYFNYIKTSEAQVESNYGSLAMCDRISDMFNAGIRLWHVLPSTNASTAYNDNPPVSE